MNNCKICGSNTKELFKAKILNKYNINYYYCDKCRFLQTEDPFWLDEAYKEPINIEDTGIVSRNINLSRKVSVLLYFLFEPKGVYLDYGGGTGLFTRLMRDRGFNFLWEDPHADNLFARGFEFSNDAKTEAITSFESFEHFVDPLNDIKKMLRISRNIIFTTEMLPEPIPEPHNWWYYGLTHGQHISFYSNKTLDIIANRFGLNYYKFNNIHIFTPKDIRKYVICALKTICKLKSHYFVRRVMESKTVKDMNFLIDNKK